MIYEHPNPAFCLQLGFICQPVDENLKCWLSGLKDPLDTSLLAALHSILQEAITENLAHIYLFFFKKKAAVVLLYLLVTVVPGAAEGISGIRSFN